MNTVTARVAAEGGQVRLVLGGILGTATADGSRATGAGGANRLRAANAALAAATAVLRGGGTAGLAVLTACAVLNSLGFSTP